MEDKTYSLERIKAIQEYLKYFPNESSANQNLLLYSACNELQIDIDDIVWYLRPRVEFGSVIINDQLRVGKKFVLTNSKTNYVHDNEGYLVQWYPTCGRLDFVREKYWYLISEEWDWLQNKLLAYNPLDYDITNSKFLFNLVNGKELINDYDNIIEKFKSKIDRKIKAFELKEKQEQFEKLKAELGE